MTALWTASDAAAATGGRAVGDWATGDWATGDWAATGISIDTRSLAPGDLFVALVGDARDGHGFAAKALEAGAAAVMVHRRPEDLPADAPCLEVEDTLAGLSALATAARARSSAEVLAITGSSGKTTTKDMAAALLGSQPDARVHAAELSLNNHWGVPLTLARMPVETTHAVLEIGMNHAGEIAPLSRLAKPDVALITMIGEAHIGNLGSIENIARAKAEIFEGLGPEGVAVLPADSAQRTILEAAAGRNRVLFGAVADAGFRLIDAQVHAGTTVVEAALDGAPWSFRIGAPGRHLASNALGALAAVAALGLDPARAALALARWAPGAGRGERWRIELGPAGLDGAVLLLDESYNANPASVRAALSVLAAQPVTDGIGRVARGRRIAFLGDMLELGAQETALHAGLAEAPEMAKVDLVHCCGPAMRALWEALPRERRGHWSETSEALAERARATLDAGDVCMVKGSKGARMGPVVAAIKALGTPRREGPEEASAPNRGGA
ncbi:MAG: UDP-N-acetylmuramoyl-tripeptide--D-alanyl-D-alanine ligase [Pseudomonadota bacterium]